MENSLENSFVLISTIHFIISKRVNKYRIFLKTKTFSKTSQNIFPNFQKNIVNSKDFIYFQCVNIGVFLSNTR